MQDEAKIIVSVPKLALTRTEAAQSLGVRPLTVDRLTKRGLLNPSRATRRPLYPVQEIERFLRETKGLPALGTDMQPEHRNFSHFRSFGQRIK